MEGGRLAASIETKAVHGIACDPFFHTQFASYEGDTVSLWDCRKMAEPVLVLPGLFNEGVTEIQWSRVKSGRLVAIGRDESHFQTWDIQSGLQINSTALPHLGSSFSNGSSSSQTSPELQSSEIEMLATNSIPKPVVCKTQKCTASHHLNF